MSTCAVVGGQFGSEGKGNVVAHIANQYDVHARVGAANAGHTIYVPKERIDCHCDAVGINQETEGCVHWTGIKCSLEGSWEKHVMQQIPCAAYANPHAIVCIGPGALISPEIFGNELRFLRNWRRERGLPDKPVHVDYRAHVIHGEQIEEEARSGLGDRIGSTSTRAREGVGVAQADRVMREQRCRLAAVELSLASFPEWDLVRICDVPKMIHNARHGQGVLLEGTQGTGLSITTGYFPYVTSRNTTSAGLAADVGVAPNSLDRVILVCRTYPIRVAGNSGPFALPSRELRWSEIGIDPETERTTVTKLLRRVATFSMPQIVEACRLNGATEIALMFADYIDPAIAGATYGDDLNLIDYPKVEEMVRSIEQDCGVPVSMLGTGPRTIWDL